MAVCTEARRITWLKMRKTKSSELRVLGPVGRRFQGGSRQVQVPLGWPSEPSIPLLFLSPP